MIDVFHWTPMPFFTNILYWFIYLFIRIFALIPLGILYVLSDVIFMVLYYVIRYRRQVVEVNLLRAFPDKTEQERKAIALKFYRNFCDQFMETLKMFGMSRAQMARHIWIKNPEILNTLNEDIKGICIATGHFGNWEWLVSIEGRTPIHFVSLYHTLRSSIADRLMLTLRQRFGTELVSMKNSLKPIVRLLKAGDPFAVVFIIDQSPKINAIEYWTRFLNQDTAVFLGMEKIAVKFNFAAMYCCLHRVSRGYYEVEVSPICAYGAQTKPYEITEAHVRLLEKDIQNQPESWLWSHRRWKHHKSSPPK